MVTSPTSRCSATSLSRRRMILPERVFGSSGTTMICRGLAIAPISFCTCWRSSWISESGASSPSSSADSLQDHERAHGLAGGLVRRADDRRLGDLRVGDQRRLDLGGGEPVAGHVHDVVDAAEQPDVAVVVLLGAVTGEVVALLLEARPVGVLEPLVVAPEGAQHRRPRLLDHEEAAGPVGHGLALVVDHVDDDAGDRLHRRAGLPGGDAGQRADHDRAGLGLPPGVHDRGLVARRWSSRYQM